MAMDTRLESLFAPGTVLLIRTAVYHALGRVEGLVMVGPIAFLSITEAAFVGDTGRYHEATVKDLSTVAEAEIEPVGYPEGEGRMLINVAVIGDVVEVPNTVRKVR
jgi:hypothetical protein